MHYNLEIFAFFHFAFTEFKDKVCKWLCVTSIEKQREIYKTK